MPQQAAFNTLRTSTSRDLRSLIGEYHAGRLSGDELGEELFSSLEESHDRAYILGARQAGSTLDADSLRELAKSSGRANADEQNTFFDNFINDLEEGRYTNDDGTVNIAAINRRVDLYSQRLRGTSEQSFIDNSDDDSQFTWHLGGAEHHCNDCPRMSALSPYSANELFTTPGQFSLTCGPGCKCFIVRDDGVKCFTRA